ncbi:hypothetical protein [Shewanella gaetbuli]
MKALSLGIVTYLAFIMAVQANQYIPAHVESHFAKAPAVEDSATASSSSSSDAETTKQAEFAAVPFIFSTETLSTAFGAAGVLKHAGQEQASAVGIGLYTSNESWVGFLGLYNYQIPTLDQWLFSAETYQGYYTEGIYYLDDHESPIEEPARVISEGNEGYTRLHIKYVLPIADGAIGAAASLYKPRNNIEWNPLTSGTTSIKFTPYSQYRELTINPDLPETARGYEVQFEWDNRNAQYDPTDGGKTSLTIKHGFAVDDFKDWTLWEFEQSAFFNLGETHWFNEQVLAANVFIADTPTWNDYDSSTQQYHRPPSFAGVYLGGFERSRGYSSKQFTGRSAVNYSLEYRVKPQWQPLQHWPVFNLYDIPWWQWVVFIEAGKVSDTFSAQALHTDMNFTAGGGVRLEVEDIVVRAELGVGSEESQFWVMVNQPF